MVISELPNQHMLPKSEIKNIHQDSEGYMWYGTDGGGICRDDGYSITVFRADFNTPELMEDNSITAITEDRVQRIWFGTKRGAYVLNKKDYQIEAIADDGIKSWVVNDIKGTKDGSVWISTGNYIYRYNSDMKRTGVYNVEWKGVAKTVYKLYEDRKGTLWQLQRNGGLLKYDSKKDEFIEVEWPFKEWPSSIYEDYAESVYWIGTWGNGIIRFDPEEKDPNKVFTIQPETIVGKETFGKEVTSIILDSVMNYLWATTMDDLYVYTLQDGILKQLSISASFPGKKKMLNGVFTDHKGNIWVLGHYPHSFIISFQKNNIIKYPVNSSELPLIPFKLVYDDGYYWFWQNRFNLCLYDTYRDDITVNEESGLLAYFEESINQKGIIATKNDSIVMLMQHNGNRIIENELCRINTKPHEKIRTLHEDAFGNVWIGTTYKLARYNFETKKLSVEWENIGKVNRIISSRERNVYINTELNGFLILNSDGRKDSIPTQENFKNMAITSDEKVYIGSQQGSIYCYDSSDKSFTSQTERMGLTGDAILDMETDRHDNLWIITNQKITIYDRIKKAFRIIRSSTPEGSLHDFMCSFKDSDGRIHVGGIGGIIAFPVDYSITYNKKSPDIHFTSIKINGNISKIPGYNNHNVILQPHETNVELFFSTLEPLETENVFYAFRYNDQKDWMYLPEGQNSIFLSRLVKGKYTLELKAIDANGIWQDGYLSIFIQRLPGWYETTWAYIIYIFLTGLIIFLMLWKYLGYRKEKQDIELKRQVADMKSEFFTNISHELRTPLTLVITPLETIMKKVTDAEIRQELQIVKRNAHNLLELINQLIDFKRIEIEKEKLILDETDMNVFLYSIFENFQWVAKEKKITFNYHTDVSGLTMSFDFDKMKKIANNLISNALKFTDEGGCVTISLQQIVDNERYYAMISIKDTGAGISEDELPFIFNRYHQSDKSSSNHGIGVGLHLVNEYVMLHQGTVTVRSVLGEGSVFTVRIPIYSEGKKRSEKNSLQADSSRKKVLIVEDNLEFRSYLRNELSQYYTIYEAINGKEGEKEALAKDPDIIVTDLMMPEMDGLELCRQIKNNIQISHIPVLLLTANNSIENEKRGYKEGADAYLNKPFDWEILLSHIKYLLEQKKDRQQEFFKAVVLSPENITISSPDEKLMKRALEVFEKNMDNSEYSIEEFSRDMGMSRNNLYRKIKAITGESPTDFLNSVRLKQAAVLLKEGHMNVNEIAYAVGFSTHSYFTQSFKKMFGVPPNKYKQ